MSTISFKVGQAIYIYPECDRIAAKGAIGPGKYLDKIIRAYLPSGEFIQVLRHPMNIR